MLKKLDIQLEILEFLEWAVVNYPLGQSMIEFNTEDRAELEDVIEEYFCDQTGYTCQGCESFERHHNCSFFICNNPKSHRYEVDHETPGCKLFELSGGAA